MLQHQPTPPRVCILGGLDITMMPSSILNYAISFARWQPPRQPVGNFKTRAECATDLSLTNEELESVFSIVAKPLSEPIPQLVAKCLQGANITLVILAKEETRDVTGIVIGSQTCLYRIVFTIACQTPPSFPGWAPPWPPMDPSRSGWPGWPIPPVVTSGETGDTIPAIKLSPGTPARSAEGVASQWYNQMTRGVGQGIVPQRPDDM